MAHTNGYGHKSPLAPFLSTSVPGYPTFMPQQPQPIGSLLDSQEFPQNADPPKLFKPITIKGVIFSNRAWVAPMCQCKLFSFFRTLKSDSLDSSDDGHATDHHLVHLGSMAMRGWGSTMVEATAVVPEGRISPEDSASPRHLQHDFHRSFDQ